MLDPPEAVADVKASATNAFCCFVLADIGICNRMSLPACLWNLSWPAPTGYESCKRTISDACSCVRHSLNSATVMPSDTPPMTCCGAPPDLAGDDTRLHSESHPTHTCHDCLPNLPYCQESELLGILEIFTSRPFLCA
jgi:hypothetical protein